LLPYFYIQELELSSEIFKGEDAEGSFTGFPVDQPNVFFEDEEQTDAKGVRLALGKAGDTDLGMTITLDETNSKHAIQVLRMKIGDQMHLTDGKGHLITASIVNDHRKHCQVSVDVIEPKEKRGAAVTVAIALTKNTSRFEWFLEKAAELGVSRVIPLITKRTETEKFKEERLHNILVSAMLQSQQTWLLQMSAPVDFNKFIADPEPVPAAQKYIAHCIETDKQYLKYSSSPSLILIGPEGDFTPEEIEAALNKGYQPVTLGETRLRTETAGMVAATILRIGH
jgi:16S rRNA (uracil1498-N3)-methyltransferase